jgi:hypothetical protein
MIECKSLCVSNELPNTHIYSPNGNEMLLKNHSRCTQIFIVGQLAK